MTMFHIYRARAETVTMSRKASRGTLHGIPLIKAISLFPSSGNLHSDDATVLAEHMIEADVGKASSRATSSRDTWGMRAQGDTVGFEKHALYPFEPVPVSPNELPERARAHHKW